MVPKQELIKDDNIETDGERYENETLLMKRRDVVPHKWELINKADGHVIDSDKYRNDLAERNNLKLTVIDLVVPKDAKVMEKED